MALASSPKATYEAHVMQSVIHTSPTTSWLPFPSFIYFPQLITSGRSIPPALGPSYQTPPLRKHLATLEWQCAADKQQRLPAGHLFLWA